MDYIPDKFAHDSNTPEGLKLWDILTREANIARMETASDLGQPALKPMEDILLAEMGPVITDHRMKQMAGHMVRQIMEERGFVHDASDIKIASTPFYKASRYRRKDADEHPVLHIFRDSGDTKQLALTGSRDSTSLPAPTGKQWSYYNTVSSPLKASVGYGFDLVDAAKIVEEQGHLLHRRERILRAPTR